jgi:hypothetical protein
MDKEKSEADYLKKMRDALLAYAGKENPCPAENDRAEASGVGGQEFSASDNS